MERGDLPADPLSLTETLGGAESPLGYHQLVTGFLDGLCERVEAIHGDDALDRIAQARSEWEGLAADPEAATHETFMARFEEACRRATTRFELDCGRCLEPFEMPVDAAFDLRYVPHEYNTGEGEREIARLDAVAQGAERRGEKGDGEPAMPSLRTMAYPQMPCR